MTLLEKRRFLYNHSGDFPQVILIIPSHVPNNTKAFGCFPKIGLLENLPAFVYPLVDPSLSAVFLGWPLYCRFRELGNIFCNCTNKGKFNHLCSITLRILVQNLLESVLFRLKGMFPEKARNFDM